MSEVKEGGIAELEYKREILSARMFFDPPIGLLIMRIQRIKNSAAIKISHVG